VLFEVPCSAYCAFQAFTTARGRRTGRAWTQRSQQDVKKWLFSAPRPSRSRKRISTARSRKAWIDSALSSTWPGRINARARLYQSQVITCQMKSMDFFAWQDAGGVNSELFTTSATRPGGKRRDFMVRYDLGLVLNRTGPAISRLAQGCAIKRRAAPCGCASHHRRAFDLREWCSLRPRRGPAPVRAARACYSSRSATSIIRCATSDSLRFLSIASLRSLR
jgi:hypothetical protein